MLLAQQLASTATKNLARPAFHYLGKEIPYSEIRNKIARLSYLYLNELGAGARVAFFTSNCPATALTFFALTNTKSVSLFLDLEMPPEQMIATLKEAQITHLAVTSDMVGRARDFLQSAHMSLPLIEIEKKQGGEYDTSYSPPADNTPQDNDVILLVRTGAPSMPGKLVQLNHKQLSHAVTCLRGRYHFQATDHFMTHMNWCHPFAMIHGMLLPLLMGATCVIDHGLEGVELLDYLVSARVTRLVGTPSFFRKILITCKNEKRTLPGTKSVTVGVGMLGAELNKVFQVLKIPVLQTYGQSESVWTIAMPDTEEEPRDDSTYCGRALPGFKYKVLDAGGDEIPGSEKRTGPLAIMSPATMSGYLGREKETKNVLRGTWLHTHDIATLEGEGDEIRVSFLGRKEDVVEIDGRWTSTSAIERALKTIPGIQDAAAVFVKTAKGEPAVGSVVVKIPGSALNEKQLIALCAEKVPSALTPRAVVFADAIPRNAGGSVIYSKLRGQFSGTIA